MNLLEKAAELQSKGLSKAAKPLLEKALAENPSDPDALHLLGLACFDEKDFVRAFSLLERAIEHSPDNKIFRKNHQRAKQRRDEQLQIIDHMRDEVSQHPRDYVRLNTLVTLLIEAGFNEEATGLGQKSLELQDYRFAKETPPSKVPRQPKRQFDCSQPERNIIAFSLWGEDEYYVDGALENAKLALKLFPGWRCRFYLDDSISSDAVRDLRNKGAQIVKMPNNQGGKFGLFWRFFVAEDSNVDYFLCRDCDCRLNLKEQAAVEEWLDLGGLFHVMRDNPKHLMLMPAGLWGGIGGALTGIEKDAREYYLQHYVPGARNVEWIDQEFLAAKVWPRIAASTLTHDSNYRIRSTRGFPSDGGLVPPSHVGGAVPRKSEHQNTQRRPVIGPRKSR